jgi:hypothetical protein
MYSRHASPAVTVERLRRVLGNKACGNDGAEQCKHTSVGTTEECAKAACGIQGRLAVLLVAESRVQSTRPAARLPSRHG